MTTFHNTIRRSLFAAIALACVLVPQTADVRAEAIVSGTVPVPKAKPSRPQDDRPAKQLFGAQAFPAKLPAKSYGFYSKGCLAGGAILEPEGPAWQAMRLSRNRNWGHPVLIDYIKRLAIEAKEAGEWPGLLVGDLAQPRGGPMLTGHASHQIGLDADIWLTPMPNKVLSVQARETYPPILMTVTKYSYKINPKAWTESRAKLLKRAASYPEVARIFVNPGIKKELCEWATGDRSWLRKVRPWYLHNYHFHVRLSCPDSDPNCRDQKPPPLGDGCGSELAHWFKPKPKPVKPAKPAKKPRKKPVMTLSALPEQCRTVLDAD